MLGLPTLLPFTPFSGNPQARMKRRSHLGWTLLAVVCGIITPLSADQFGDFTYTENATSITITDCSNMAVGAVVIPATIAGKPVTVIADYAFSYCDKITSVSIPDGVTAIGFGAFIGCWYLVDCPLPAGVTSIGSWAFQECVSLTGITLPAGVTTIPDTLFFNCEDLESVTISGPISSLGRHAFQGCSSLTSITFPEVSPLTSVSDSAFSGCSALASITLPPTVTEIAESAFKGCGSLTAVTIPEGVTRIEASTFDGCSKLADLTILGDVKAIGEAAFRNCGKLENFRIADGITRIEASTFDGCSSLANVTILGDVSYIGDYAFRACGKLAKITFPASLRQINRSVFKDCASLTSVSIPAGVQTILESAFEGCSSLTAIIVHAANSRYSSLDGVLYSKTQRSLIQFPGGKSGELTILAKTEEILPGAFFVCPNLTAIHVEPSNPVYYSTDGMLVAKSQSVLMRCPGGKVGRATIPNSVLRIGDAAFDSCRFITGVRFITNLYSIGVASFRDCDSLTTITIPPSLQTIGASAFQSCGNLTSAYFLGDAPSSLSSGVFAGAAPGFTIYYIFGKFGFTSPTFIGYPAVSMGALSQPAIWLLTNGLPRDASLQSDPNSDGVSLLMAYALNLDPQQNLSGSMPAAVVNGDQLSLTFYAIRAGVTYEVQRSENLTDWTTSGVTVSAPDAGGFRTASVEMTEASCVLRIVAKY